MEKLTEIMNKIGLPFAYDHFAEGESPDPPFICYLTPNSDNFAADGQGYYNGLYTDCKDLSAEQRIEAVLNQHGIFYKKSETWIESEKLYEVLYSFEMEVN